MTRLAPKLLRELGLGVACCALVRCAVYDGSLLDVAPSAGASGEKNGGTAGVAVSGGSSGSAPNAGSGAETSVPDAGSAGDTQATAGSAASGGAGTSGIAGSTGNAGSAGSITVGGSAGVSGAGGSAVTTGGAGGSDSGTSGSAGSAVGGAGGTGTAGVGGGGGAAPLCNTVVVGSGTLGSIDDFDDGNAFILPSDGRSGSWTFTSDGTGTTTPAPGTATPSAVGEMGLAQRVQGAGLTGNGAELAAGVVPLGDCYDASAYRGVNIALKGSGQVELSVLTAAVNAQPTAKQDQYKASVTLTNAWQDLSFAWSEFHQSGYAGATVVPFDNTKITGFALTPHSANKPLSFDITIDNLALRKKTN